MTNVKYICKIISNLEFDILCPKEKMFLLHWTGRFNLIYIRGGIKLQKDIQDKYTQQIPGMIL